MSVGWDDEGRGWFDEMETGEEVDPTMCDREDCVVAHDLNVSCAVAQSGALVTVGDTFFSEMEIVLSKPREPKSEYYCSVMRCGAQDLMPASCYLCAQLSYLDEGADGRCRSCGMMRHLHLNHNSRQGCFSYNSRVTIVCAACRAAEVLEDRQPQPLSDQELLKKAFMIDPEDLLVRDK